MTKRITGLLALAMLALFGCSHRSAQQSLSEIDQTAVRAAVFENMVASWKVRRWPIVMFLDVPSGEFAALAKRGSQLGATVEPVHRYEDGYGVRCTIADIKQEGTQVRVSGGYSFGNLGGEWGHFVVEKRGSRWVVAEWVPTVFS